MTHNRINPLELIANAKASRTPITPSNVAKLMHLAETLKDQLKPNLHTQNLLREIDAYEKWHTRTQKNRGQNKKWL